MKDDTRRRLSELILEELADKIRLDENLRKRLEVFTDLPVEKVADAILKQFEYLLSSDLRELIIHLIEQEIAAEESEARLATMKPMVKTPAEIPVVPRTPTPTVAAPVEPVVEIPTSKENKKPEPIPLVEEPAEEPDAVSTSSVMEHFGARESFPTAPVDFELTANDWLYLYAFSYAPDSTGKGLPTRKLLMKGVDTSNDLFMLDYGDVRFFLHRFTSENYPTDRAGKPILGPAKAVGAKYQHEKILNVLRRDEVIVPFPFWTIIQGRENIIKNIEDSYVELLRGLIDIHDAVEWDVEVFAYDQHIVKLPSIAEGVKPRTPLRETKHQVSRGRDPKVTEKLVVREKGIAQDIHSHLLLHATKAKMDFIIRLDNALMDDWKSILSARYTVGKDKRKMFCHAVEHLQNEYAEYQLMLRVTNPNTRISFLR